MQRIRILIVIACLLFSTLTMAQTIYPKHPSVDAIKRCYPVGCSWWQAKLNTAQISLDYPIYLISYGYDSIEIQLGEACSLWVFMRFEFQDNKLVKGRYQKGWYNSDLQDWENASCEWGETSQN